MKAEEQRDKKVKGVRKRMAGEMNHEIQAGCRGNKIDKARRKWRARKLRCKDQLFQSTG